MTFSAVSQPIKRRSRNNSLTKREVAAAWDRLRTAAGGGDIKACALLIALAERRPVIGLPAGGQA